MVHCMCPLKKRRGVFMRKALIVGINYYEHANCLRGAVNDATHIGETLKNHYNAKTDRYDRPNFDVTLKVARNADSAISKSELRKAVEAVFDGNPTVALFYFAGHGTFDRFGGYLCASDCHPGEPDEGLSLEYVMNVVRESRAENKIVILDSCFSGMIGDYANLRGVASLPENTTLLAACQKYQTADEPKGRGLFTSLMYEALNGGAMNVLGEISPSSIYDYVEKSLAPWEQRPVFKANVQSSICLRHEKSRIEIKDLRRITELFYDSHSEIQLSPRYEMDKKDADDKTYDPEKEEDFRVLRKMNAVNLVVPVGEEYMYWAAIRYKSCKLTARGRQYWNMVATDRI